MFLVLVRWLALGATLAHCSAAPSILSDKHEHLPLEHHNEYGPPLHVASSVLQLEPEAHIELPAEHAADAWHSSGLSPGYEVWLQPHDEPLHYLPPSVFAGASHPVSELHTHVALSDNVDFDNVADLQPHSKSYGK